jgi:LPS-assembly protein
VEPIVQAFYSEAIGTDVPNEDSQQPEFDETKLLSLNRFPWLDLDETGLRAKLGVHYNRYDPAGWSMGVTLGRVLHAQEATEFPEGTGLAGGW